jgi:excisionase family DNA binding protein
MSGQGKQERTLSHFTGCDLMRARDVAMFFGCSLPNAYALMKSGRIPVIRIGRSVRVSRKALEAWIEEESRESLAA